MSIVSIPAFMFQFDDFKIYPSQLGALLAQMDQKQKEEFWVGFEEELMAAADRGEEIKHNIRFTSK